MSRRERVERKRETREDGREVGGEGVSAWAADQPSPGPFSKALMTISQCILLSQNLSCKKDSVKAATIAARGCVIRENYQVVSWEPGVRVGVEMNKPSAAEPEPQERP